MGKPFRTMPCRWKETRCRATGNGYEQGCGNARRTRGGRVQTVGSKNYAVGSHEHQGGCKASRSRRDLCSEKETSATPIGIAAGGGKRNDGRCANQRGIRSSVLRI